MLGKMANQPIGALQTVGYFHKNLAKIRHFNINIFQFWNDNV